MSVYMCIPRLPMSEKQETITKIRWDWDYWTPSFVYVSILFLATAESNYSQEPELPVMVSVRD